MPKILRSYVGFVLTVLSTVPRPSFAVWRSGGGMRRWWAGLLAVVLALSLAPGTAVAQQDTTPPSPISVFVFGHFEMFQTYLEVSFDELLSGDNLSSLTFGVTVDDGKSRTVASVQYVPDRQGFRLTVRPWIPDGAVIVVSYNLHPQSTSYLQDPSGNLVEEFRWKVGVGQIATVAEVYDKLRSYFSGSVTLSEVEDVLSGDDQTYHEKLVEEAAAGRLHERLPASEGTNWSGEDETEGWVQIGSPSRLPDSSDTCGGETAPELTGGDQANFYWACSDENTSNGRWIPVRIPQPGVDYAWDYQLLRPGDPEYNEECLYVRRDEDGNPVLDENGDRIPRRVSSYDPATDTFTYNDGNSWDPIAEQCTTRGNPGSGPVFRH